jgi:hypothetical protein
VDQPDFVLPIAYFPALGLKWRQIACTCLGVILAGLAAAEIWAVAEERAFERRHQAAEQRVMVARAGFSSNWIGYDPEPRGLIGGDERGTITLWLYSDPQAKFDWLGTDAA